MKNQKKEKTKMSNTVTQKKTTIKGRPVEKLFFGLDVMFQTRALEAALKRRTDMAKYVVGKVYGSLGEEAVGIGAVLALNKDDLISPLIRNLSAVLARQVPLVSVFANCFGKADGPTKGRDANINASWPEYGILSRISLLATMVPVLNGWAYWQKQTRTGRVALTWLGDGGVSLGDFHEGLNFAAVLRSPLVVVIQNNQIALGTPLKNQTRNTRFIDRAIGYGIPGFECDGNDLFDVWEKVEKAVKACREGVGPALVVAETYRRSAHNLTDLKTTEKLFPEVLAKGLAHDPVEFLISELEKEGAATREELMARKAKIEEEVEAAALEAEKLPDPKPGSHTVGVWAPWVPTAHTGTPAGPPRKYFDAINEALDLALKEKPNVLLLGEDVGHYEGAFHITHDLLKRYGPQRVIDTPIAESGLTGFCSGAALAGARPIGEYQFADFCTNATSQLSQFAAKLHWRTGQTAPFVMRFPVGGTIGAHTGPYHGWSAENHFLNQPSFYIVYPATPSDAKRLLLASLEQQNPVLYFEHKSLYGRSELREPINGKTYAAPISEPLPPGWAATQIGKSIVRREGKDLSLVTYGFCMHQSLLAAQALAEEGIEVEVIDLRTLVPLDEKTIWGSFKKTGRLLIAHEAYEEGGLGLIIVGKLMKDLELFSLLQAPPKIISSTFAPVPQQEVHEREHYPTAQKIYDAAKRVLEY